MQAKMPCRNAPETLGWIALLLIPALTVQSMAEGFKNPPEGAAALGRAGGRIAIADDAAAVSHNPANLVDLEGTEVQAAVTIVHAETEYDSPMGGSTETESPWKFLPNLYAVKRSACSACIQGFWWLLCSIWSAKACSFSLR